jgi:lipoprotein-anchoring transpeptidase ErfK/SrfK
MRISLLLLLLFSAVTSFADENNYPSPTNARVLPSNDILYRRDYRQVIGAIDIYAAPNGDYLHSRPAGTFFVTVNRYQDGWAEINEGQWIRAEQLAPAPLSSLGGVLLDETSDYPLAFLHENAVVFGTDGRASDLVIAEYSLVHVYSDASYEGEPIAEIGENQWIRQSSIRYVQPISRPAEISSEHWVAIDVEQQVIIAYAGETAVFATLVSTGSELTPTTTGVFDTYARFNPRDMSRGALDEPWFYHMEDVPYTFYFNGNQALHGAYWHNNFGNRQSHGCVNMSLSDAYWVYAFLSESLDLTDPTAVWPQVYVYNQ